MAATTPNGLHELPSNTRSKLRSTQILVSLPQIISELVQNSLDAGASQIDIGVNCEEWSCWVRDNGHGISKADLTALQSAERYGTSKAYTNESLGEVSTFGFRGEALASAADLCCLEICSRTARARETWSLILKGGQSLYSGPAIRWRRESSGTVLCIRDAFYNLPVRRRSHPSPSRTLELVRKDLENFALVFAHVTFALENTHKVHTPRPDTGRIIKIPKTTSTLQTFRHLFGRALVEHVYDVDVTHNSLKIEGFISLCGAQTKSYQFLYINKHPISPCNLHRTIESKFNHSSFAKHALNDYQQLSQPLDAVRRSPRKSDKKPVYVLNITIPPTEVDNCVEPAKNAVQLQDSDSVTTLLAFVVQKFLVENGFASAPSPFDDFRTPASPRKRRKLDSDDRTQLMPFGRMHVSSSNNHAPIVHPGYGDEDEDEDDPTVTWVNPLTGGAYVVDKRTGNSYPVGAVPEEYDGCETQGRRTLNIRNQERSESDRKTPAWLKNALQQNQVYALNGAQIPSLSLSTAFAEDMDKSHSCHGRHTTFQGKASSFSRAESQLAQFSKLDLQKAVVLGQVDQKFIACIIPKIAASSSSRPSQPTGTLVLIDQHAAHERVRVERFMQQLCGSSVEDSQMRVLDPPKSIVLTSHETRMLRTSKDIQSAFSRWGIRFSDMSNDGAEVVEESYGQVDVQSVPEVVADKLLSEDRLRDLVKSYLHELHDSNTAIAIVASRKAADDKDQTSWQRAMQWCPQDLRDLVNSKACRGAIMFNDPLSLERCKRLITELCETTLPFQCAHGRPSLVPLTRIQGEIAEQQAARHVKPVDWSEYGRSRRV